MDTHLATDMAKKFSNEFRQWRGTRSQSKAAKALMVTTKSVQNWEQGCCIPKHLAMIREMMSLNPDLS